MGNWMKHSHRAGDQCVKGWGWLEAQKPKGKTSLRPLLQCHGFCQGTDVPPSSQVRRAEGKPAAGAAHGRGTLLGTAATAGPAAHHPSRRPTAPCCQGPRRARSMCGWAPARRGRRGAPHRWASPRRAARQEQQLRMEETAVGGPRPWFPSGPRPFRHPDQWSAHTDACAVAGAREVGGEKSDVSVAVHQRKLVLG